METGAPAIPERPPMTDPLDTTIAGIAVSVDVAAVRVSSRRPLRVLSSALVGGGFGETHDIVDMHVDDVAPGFVAGTRPARLRRRARHRGAVRRTDDGGGPPSTPAWRSPPPAS